MIAVHVGAGYHGNTKLPAYKLVCQDACNQATQLLKEGGKAADAAILAVKILENSPVTNAGFGSNLTEKGTVECDACIMTGDLKFGACGAVSDIKNPITLAGKILENQHKSHLLGRVPPCVLVGNGATDWARDHNVHMCDNSDCMKSDQSILAYNKYMSRLKTAINGYEATTTTTTTTKEPLLAEDEFLIDGEFVNEVEVTDTVGAVCVDTDGNMASAASSGGILLKTPGRIGPAAMYGCGCWAENITSNSQNAKGVAIAASGCGEQLMQTMLVRDCAKSVLKNSESEPLCSTVQSTFSSFLADSTLTGERNAGLLVLYRESEQDELVWAHSTSSMVLGYSSIEHNKPVTVVSRNPGKAGHSNVLGGKLIAH